MHIKPVLLQYCFYVFLCWWCDYIDLLQHPIFLPYMCSDHWLQFSRSAIFRTTCVDSLPNVFILSWIRISIVMGSFFVGTTLIWGFLLQTHGIVHRPQSSYSPETTVSAVVVSITVFVVLLVLSSLWWRWWWWCPVLLWPMPVPKVS